MTEFTMPSLGADMEAGTLVEWKIKPGDRVERGQIVAVVETEKAAIEVEIWTAGVIDRLIVEPGAKVPVGAVLATLRAEAEVAAAPSAPAPAAPVGPPAPIPAQPPRAGAVEPVPALPHPRHRVSPAARKRARELGIDLERVPGSGPHGAVTLHDVEHAAHHPVAPPPAPERRDTTGLRRAIAAAMARSKREIPHYYLATTIEMTRATNWIDDENARRPLADRLILAALLIKAVARAAVEFPELNGRWVDGEHRPSARVNVGIAVSLRGGGVITPALLDAERKPVGQLMREMQDLVNRARAGTLRSSELSEGTITVTSLGDRAPETVFGVIYPPQVALVGFGGIVHRAWAIEDAVAVRPVMTATLAADHRASDGHRGGQFLVELERLLQTPEKL